MYRTSTASSVFNAVFIALIVIAGGSASAQNGAAMRAADSITPAGLLRYLSAITDDSTRGRQTPSKELESVARYLGARLGQFGLKPGGDNGSFLQEYPFEVIRFDFDRSGIILPGGSRFPLGEKVLYLGGRLSGSAGKATAPAILVSGLPERPAEIDSIANAITGKVALVVAGYEGQAADVHHDFIANLIGRRPGPAALVLLAQRPDSDWAYIEWQLKLGKARQLGTPEAKNRPMPILEVRDDVFGALLAKRGFDIVAARHNPHQRLTLTPLEDLDVTVELHDSVTVSHSVNVVAILEGSDPRLKDEYVALSAHMDHLGVGPVVRGDSIYNGADDNGSGTVGMVGVAQALALVGPAPRRSVIVLLASGEERGSLGSQYFVAHPPVPISQVVANFTADMIGRNWKDSIAVVGKEYSDLGATVSAVARQHPELKMRPVDGPPNFFGRSDEISFARKGVPVLYFHNGEHTDYHRPSDEVGKIDPEKLSRVTKLMFYLVLTVANAEQRPQWDAKYYQKIVGR